MIALITASKPMAEASKRICRLYKTEYIFKNELFRHLNDSYMANMPPTVPIVAKVTTAAPPPKAASLPILEESKSSETAFVLIGGFI